MNLFIKYLSNCYTIFGVVLVLCITVKIFKGCNFIKPSLMLTINKLF